MLNPTKLTFAYVQTHLSSPALRRVLWKDFLCGVLGIQEGQPAEGIDGSRIVHPRSVFHQGFESVCILLLISTAFIVPIELSFWSNRDPCSPSDVLPYFMLADAFFIVDLVYRFFVGVERPGGIYIDHIPQVSAVTWPPPRCLTTQRPTSCCVS